MPTTGTSWGPGAGSPLICIGINPSTAAPGDLDNTLKSVERIAAGNGYDSFLMFNVYAQRATRPEDMDQVCNAALHRENMAAFRYVLEQVGAGYAPAVWAAWGTIIEKRPYLRDCVRDMVAIGEAYGAQWLCAGKLLQERPSPPPPLPAEGREGAALCRGALPGQPVKAGHRFPQRTSPRLENARRGDAVYSRGSRAIRPAR